MRVLSGLALMLVAGSALASPVTMNTPFIQWYSDEYVNIGYPNISMGDCRSIGCSGFDHGGYTVSVTNDAGATASSYHYGSIDYAMSYSGGTTDYDFHSFEEVSASVDAGATGYALADISIYRFIVTFEVSEPVLYTGTFDIYAGSGVYSPGYVEDLSWIQSGTMLQAGQYSTTVEFKDWLTTDYVHSGQSLYLARDTNWNFTFTAVPVPATIPLFAFGLLGIAWSRRKRTH